MATLMTHGQSVNPLYGARAGIYLQLSGPGIGFVRDPGKGFVIEREVMVVDERSVVRYSESVPMSQLPDFTAALDAARRIPGLRAS